MIWSDTLQDVVNSMDEIEPYLFLGGVGVISNNTYKTFNIRKVISVLGTERELQEVKNNLSEEDVNHTCILIRDNGRDPIEAGSAKSVILLFLTDKLSWENSNKLTFSGLVIYIFEDIIKTTSLFFLFHEVYKIVCLYLNLIYVHLCLNLHFYF